VVVEEDPGSSTDLKGSVSCRESRGVAGHRLTLTLALDGEEPPTPAPDDVVAAIGVASATGGAD